MPKRKPLCLLQQACARGIKPWYVICFQLDKSVQVVKPFCFQSSNLSCCTTCTGMYSLVTHYYSITYSQMYTTSAQFQEFQRNNFLLFFLTLWCRRCQESGHRQNCPGWLIFSGIGQSSVDARVNSGTDHARTSFPLIVSRSGCPPRLFMAAATRCTDR